MFYAIFPKLIRLFLGSLYLIVHLIFASSVHAEGSKQWSPSVSDNNYLKVNASGSYAFGGYGLPEAKRLHIQIRSPSTEEVHIGLSRMVNEAGNYDITTAYQFRIVSPSGLIVHGPFSVNSPNISSHSQAVAGPSAINSGGYATGGMWTFKPTSSGDHYIEFSTRGSIRWFDITVATSGSVPSEINGRLWSRAWTARADDGYTTTADAFDTPFNGAMVAYDGKYATKIDFNGSGIRPLEGQFSFNDTGTGNTGNKENDRKSVQGSNSGNPGHQIFLNTPDPSIYPVRAQGQLQNLPLKVEDPSSPDISIEVTQAGRIELLLNFGGGNKDRRLFANVAAGVNQIPWDGETGEGIQVQPHHFPIPVNIAYTQGETHFTVYDVEGLDNGFKVYTNTSTGTVGPRLQFWDDSNIAYSPGTSDVQINVDTGASTRRRWTEYNYGNINTLNTWWFAYRDAQSTTILLPGDYGDAPNAYASAMHAVPETPLAYLGAIAPDKEDAPNTPLDGSGDNVAGSADEDAIQGSPADIALDATSYELNVLCVGEGATVAGWIDLDNNTTFDSSERVVTTCQSGNASLTWNGLSGLSVGTTYLRLRIATVAAEVAGPSSAAADGEVEDYALLISESSYDYGDAPNDGIDFNYGIAKHVIATTDGLTIGSIKAQPEEASELAAWTSEWVSNKSWFTDNKANRKKPKQPKKNKNDKSKKSKKSSKSSSGDTTAEALLDPIPDVVGDGSEEDGLVVTTSTWSNGRSCSGLLPNGIQGTISMSESLYCITVKTSNPSSIAAQLVAWIDFDQNGVFDDPEERSVVAVDANTGNDDTQGNVPAGTSGEDVVLYWEGLDKLSGNFNSFIRMRLTSDPEFKSNNSPDPIGVAINGEVEDTAIGINIEGTDYGDAPASYGDASHIIELDAYLGTTIDNEATSQYSADALDDDAIDTVNHNYDDDDGVANFPPLTVSTQNYSVEVTVTSPTSQAATLVGWIDFDGNGTFDSDEATSVVVAQDTTESVVTLLWNNIPGDISGGDSFIRLRLSSDTGLSTSTALGPMSDGEVEDYALTIVDPSNFSCSSKVDIWYANDESGSVNATEFTQARDFIYQVTDGFYHAVADGAQGGLVGWAYGATPINVIMPITDTFFDQGDSGLATTGTTVDGDGFGVRENYTVKVDASGGTQLANATQGLANLINAGNGRRTGVPQVAVILTDAPSSQINNVASNGGGTAWEAAAANLRAAGPDGTRIILVLLAEAADAYDNNVASRATIEAVIDSTGVVVQTASYALVADEVNGYIDQTITAICSAATFPVTDDYSDAPADGSIAPNGVDSTAYGDATHSIVNELQLGAAIDAENASIASPSAAGDGADDDGISTFPVLTPSNINYQVSVSVSNTTGNPGRLLAWIDFDGNGQFDMDEAAARVIPTGTTNGSFLMTWSSIPPDIQDGNTFLRLRLTTDALNAGQVNGAKSDGEVEDYSLTIGSAGAFVSGRVYVDANRNETKDTGEAGIGNTVVVLHDFFSGTCQSVNTAPSGDYRFSGVSNGDYEVYQAHGETTPVPQSCGTNFANNPTEYQSTTADILYVSVANTDITDQDFGEAPDSSTTTPDNVGTGITFEPDHQSEILPGNTVFYAHAFSVEASGGVRFTAMGSGNTVSGWTQVLYRDTDCNGKLNGAESNTSISNMNFGLSAGNRLCIINKVYAPANVPAQDHFKVKTTAKFTFTNILIAPAALPVIDLTTAVQVVTPTTPNPQVGESRLELTKSVQNLSQLPLPPESQTINQAFPGDVLMYRIYYKNTGTGPITDLTVNDTVPAYTSLVLSNSACDNTPVGMTCILIISNDQLNWDFTGPLIGGAKGNVSYQVRVDN